MQPTDITDQEIAPYLALYAECFPEDIPDPNAMKQSYRTYLDGLANELLLETEFFLAIP